NFAKVYINDKYIGLYSNVETVNKKFCSDHFGTSDHVFVKGNPDKPGNNSTSNLVFNTYDSTKYYIYYGMENGFGWYKLIALMDTLKNNSIALPKIMDIDRAIWMHAYNSVFSNYDSYTGSFSQNYYLYEDDYGRFLPVIWDLNMSIGGFPGSLGGGGGTTLDKITFFNGETNVARPLIQQILKNPTYKKMYTAHVRTLCNEFVANKEYEIIAKRLQTKVDSLVKTDPNSLTTYAAFQTSLTAAITSGGGPGGTAPGISTLMNARLAYFKTVPEFNAIPPVISNINTVTKNPKVGDTVWINARITNVTNAYLAYRENKYSLFEKPVMADDGLHNDQKAGDGIYGSYVIANTKNTQYYIYAENINAGVFSPERAEYEYHVLEATESFADIKKGEVVVNEFMTSNKTTVIDVSDGKYEDWLELYNNTDKNLILDGIFLTDNFAKPTKWEFPKGVQIKAKDRIVLWLDEDSSDSTGLHTNFKLSSTSEEIMLSRADGLVIDSLRFGAIPTDNSFERCPDGTGSFKIASASTYNKVNCKVVNSTANLNSESIHIYPNPVSGILNIESDNLGISEVEIFDLSGRSLFKLVNFTLNKLTLNTHFLISGIYFIKVKTFSNSIIFHKLSVD
ncbi:MAG: CotH kinase family protein, partial [Saprospiraceae bacterium]